MRAPQSLFAAVLALSAGRPIFTADYYAVDGVTGKVASFVDWNDPTHVLAQSTDARQVDVSAPHVDFAGNLCATFVAADDAGNGNFYASNRAVAAWKFLHDGSGARLVHTMSPGTLASCHYFGTYTGGAVPGAFLSSLGGTFNQARFVLANDAGAFAVDATHAAGSLALDTPRYYQLRYTEGASPEYQSYDNATQATTGSSAAAPGTGSPTQPLHLGHRANGTAPCNMRWREWFSGPDTPAFAAAIQAYELGTNGLAA